jgi:hypothetical protein
VQVIDSTLPRSSVFNGYTFVFSVVGPRSFIGVDTCRADALLMHELLGSSEVREWLQWTGSQQALLHSTALGMLLQVNSIVSITITFQND